MVILVLNCGSSSIKYQVIDMEAASSKLLAKGIVERIGLPEGDLTHKPVGKEPFELHRPIPDHTTGIKLVLDALTDPAHGVIGSLDEVKAVGHRVAHGGEFFPESCIVTEEVKSKIRSLFEIAPLPPLDRGGDCRPSAGYPLYSGHAPQGRKRASFQRGFVPLDSWGAGPRPEGLRGGVRDAGRGCPGRRAGLFFQPRNE